MRGALGLAMALALLCAAPPLAAQNAQEVQSARSAAIRKLDLQIEMQLKEARSGTVRDLDLQLELPHAADDDAGWHLRLPQELLWIVALCGVAWLLYSLKDVVPSWRFARRGEWTGLAADQGPAVGERTPEAVTLAADELARQGRFVEAMHVLLLQSLADIRQRLDEEFADSLTSREILRSARLSDQGRGLLREIIARVEWTYFGEHPAGLVDYEACRTSFNALSLALRAEAGA